MSDALLDMNDQDISAMATLFSLLGDPTRVRIVLLLCRGEQNVRSLCTALGLPQPTVSHHLGLLRRGGILKSRRDGKSIHYSLDGRCQMVDGTEFHIEGMGGIRIRVSR